MYVRVQWSRYNLPKSPWQGYGLEKNIDKHQIRQREQPLAYCAAMQLELFTCSRQQLLLILITLLARSAGIISRLKNTVDWFFMREKYCSDWKNKSNKTDYNPDEQDLRNPPVLHVSKEPPMYLWYELKHARSMHTYASNEADRY
jgi:hypothetical protein